MAIGARGTPSRCRRCRPGRRRPHPPTSIWASVAAASCRSRDLAGQGRPSGRTTASARRRRARRLRAAYADADALSTGPPRSLGSDDLGVVGDDVGAASGGEGAPPPPRAADGGGGGSEHGRLQHLPRALPRARRRSTRWLRRPTTSSRCSTALMRGLGRRRCRDVPGGAARATHVGRRRAVRRRRRAARRARGGGRAARRGGCVAISAVADAPGPPAAVGGTAAERDGGAAAPPRPPRHRCGGRGRGREPQVGDGNRRGRSTRRRRDARRAWTSTASARPPSENRRRRAAVARPHARRADRRPANAAPSRSEVRDRDGARAQRRSGTCATEDADA